VLYTQDDDDDDDGDDLKLWTNREEDLEKKEKENGYISDKCGDH
jgi:hypothetical protein